MISKKSLLQDKKECYKCKRTIALHQHHIYEGRNRKNSDKDGCWIWLCPRHHNMSDKGIHFDKQFDLEVKRECEKVWLEYYKKTIEDFIKRYRRNYL